MNKSVLAAALAIATSWPARMNTAYTERLDTQRAEHERAQEKKRRVREQIRARRAARKDGK